MKKLLIIAWICISPWAWAQNSPGTNTPKMTLQQCVEYALKTTAPVQKAFIDTKIAEAQVKEVAAMGYPQIDGSVQFTNNFEIQTAFLPAAFFAEDPVNNPPPPDAPPVAVQFGVQYSGNIAASVNQLLFDGSFFLGLKAAKTYTELSNKVLIQTKVEVVSAISKAYYSVLVNQERLGLLQQNVARIDTLLRQTRALYENGFSEKIDVDRIQVSYNNLVTEQKKTERLVTLSIQLLKFQMGMPLDEPMEPAETLADIEISNMNLMDADVNYADRIEYSLLETQLQLDQLNVKRYQVQYYPSVYAFANFGINAGANELSGMDQWFKFGLYGLQVNIPIFDGFRKSSLIQQAKLTMKKTEIDKIDLTRNIDLQTQQAKINLQNAVNDMESQSRNMELAKEVYRVAKVKFEEGVGSTLEVVDAETAYKDAETNYYAAVYDALISKVDFEKATGKLYQP